MKAEIYSPKGKLLRTVKADRVLRVSAVPTGDRNTELHYVTEIEFQEKKVAIVPPNYFVILIDDN